MSPRPKKVSNEPAYWQRNSVNKINASAERRPYEPTYWHKNSVGDTPQRTEDIDSAALEQDDEFDTVSKIKLKLQEVQDAHVKIRDEIAKTPLLEAKYVGNKKTKVYFKCENLQYTGSFKVRGALNVFCNMSPAEKSKGCVVSGGRNFILAMTSYGHRQSVPINVVISKDCPIADRQSYKENFAIVKVHGNDANEANLHALTYCDEIGAKYIHGTDRVDLMAGYGTVGLEILTQLDKLDAIICPVGSGSFIAGVIVAVKSLKPNCLIYGVECSASPVMTKALQEKKPVAVQMSSTIANSLSHMIASKNAFHIIRRYLDRMVTVDDAWITRAMITMLEREKLLVEGAGACSVAAILANKVPELIGKNVVCILSGGNINSSQIPQVIDRGLVAEGRLVKFTTNLPDVPGALAKLIFRLGEAGVDIRSLVPERKLTKKDIFAVCVNMTLETANATHSQEIRNRLLKEYPESEFNMI